MRRVRPAVRLLAVTGLVIGVALIGSAPSQAAEVTSGWWWKLNVGASTAFPTPVPNQPLPATPPAPPTPPTADGGLLVGATPDGALAIAAVRSTEAATSITLKVAANGDAAGALAHLLACATTSPWMTAAGGRWDDKPIVACDLANGGGSVAGIRSEDGASWTFPVAPLATEAGSDVVIVPIADSQTGLLAPFQITFVAPTPADLVLAPKTEVPASDDFDSSDASASDGTAFDASPIGGGDFGLVPSLVGGGDTRVPLVSPALNAREQSPNLALRPTSAPLKSDGGQELAGALVVLASLALFYGTSRQALPAPHSLVDVGIVRDAPVTANLGGVGRFARPREGTPPSLH